MPDYTVNVFRIANIGGTNGLEAAGSITIRDDDGFRDTILDDIEQAGSTETNGDQEIIASGVTELGVGETIRARGIFRFTNDVTGETYDVREIYSQSSGDPVEQLFVFTSTVPPWVFDGTSRSFALVNSDGTLPYASIVCFAEGTLIAVGDGQEVPIETLRVGDRVLTKDSGPQKIRWIGSTTVTAEDLAERPKLRPVRICAGALGRGLPKIDLLVSPQHRIFMRSPIALRMFGAEEILVPAIKLIEMDGISVADDVEDLTYFHILFDAHQIIFSNGAATESLLTGAEAIKALSDDARTEIMTLFPSICAPGFSPKHARPVPQNGKEIRHLLARHRKNMKPLVSEL